MADPEGKDIEAIDPAVAAVEPAVVAAEADGASTAPAVAAVVDDAPKSMLDAVNDALKPAEKPADAAKPDAAPEDPVKAAADKEAADKAAAEAAENDPVALRKQVDEFRPRAEAFDHFVGYMQKANLTDADVNAGMEIMALMKGDPKVALAKLEPYVQTLREMVGESLPADLQEHVDAGLVTEEIAREYAKVRHQAASGQATVEQVTQAQATAANQAVVQRMRGAVAAWEAQVTASDPDYGVKKSAVLDAVQARIAREGRYPKDENEAVTWSKEALAAVNKIAQHGRAPKAQTAPITPVGGAATTAAEPKTYVDAVNMALAATATR